MLYSDRFTNIDLLENSERAPFATDVIYHGGTIDRENFNFAGNLDYISSLHTHIRHSLGQSFTIYNEVEYRTLGFHISVCDTEVYRTRITFSECGRCRKRSAIASRQHFQVVLKHLIVGMSPGSWPPNPLRASIREHGSSKEFLSSFHPQA